MNHPNLTDHVEFAEQKRKIERLEQDRNGLVVKKTITDNPAYDRLGAQIQDERAVLETHRSAAIDHVLNKAEEQLRPLVKQIVEGLLAASDANNQAKQLLAHTVNEAGGVLTHGTDEEKSRAYRIINMQGVVLGLLGSDTRQVDRYLATCRAAGFID